MVTLREIVFGNHDKLSRLFRNPQYARIDDFVRCAYDTGLKEKSICIRTNGFYTIPENISLEELYNVILYATAEISKKALGDPTKAIGLFQGIYQFVRNTNKMVYIPDVQIYIGIESGIIPIKENWHIDKPITHISMIHYPSIESRNYYL